MTLNDIITGALVQLDKGTDAMTFDAFRAKFTAFANDAQNDLACVIKPYRTDTVLPVGSRADLRNLPRSCIKIIGITQLGRSVKFARGESSDIILLPHNSPAAITYIFRPAPLSNLNDISELPESVHSLIIMYIVGRERMSGDVSTQRGSRMHLAMYENAKAGLTAGIGESAENQFINKY